MQPGDLVVCIDDRAWPADFVAVTQARPVRGVIYTVRSIGVIGGEAGVLLEEVRNPTVPCFWLNGRPCCSEPHFNPARFRPAAKPSIAAIRAIGLTKREGAGH